MSKLASRFKFFYCFCNVRNVLVQDCPSLEADRAECQKLQTAKKNVEVFFYWQLLFYLKGRVAWYMWWVFLNDQPIHTFYSAAHTNVLFLPKKYNFYSIMFALFLLLEYNLSFAGNLLLFSAAASPWHRLGYKSVLLSYDILCLFISCSVLFTCINFMPAYS
jgi:hypothetical protein